MASGYNFSFFKLSVINMQERNIRFLNALIGLGCFGAIAFAYFYLEHTLFMTPCPLCMMQRLAFGLIGLAFLLDALIVPKSYGRWLLGAFKFLVIFFGIALAARHLWIQSLPPDQVPSCGLDFYALMKRNTLFDGLWQAMQGDGDCATKDTWLGLSIPMWSMLLYVGLLLLAVVVRPRGR